MSYTILLVDGDAARRERLAQQLALFGDPMLLRAGSGTEALAQIASWRRLPFDRWTQCSSKPNSPIWAARIFAG
jgi:hypothetical protein